MSRFCQKVRELRHAKGLSLRNVAQHVGVGYMYLNKIEKRCLEFDDYPSEALIRKLAETLVCNEDKFSCSPRT